MKKSKIEIQSLRQIHPNYEVELLPWLGIRDLIRLTATSRQLRAEALPELCKRADKASIFDIAINQLWRYGDIEERMKTYMYEGYEPIMAETIRDVILSNVLTFRTKRYVVYWIVDCNVFGCTRDKDGIYKHVERLHIDAPTNVDDFWILPLLRTLSESYGISSEYTNDKIYGGKCYYYGSPYDVLDI